jgi:hypothetical protein
MQQQQLALNAVDSSARNSANERLLFAAEK